MTHYFLRLFVLTILLNASALLPSQAQSINCYGPYELNVTQVTATSASIYFAYPSPSRPYTVTYYPLGSTSSAAVTVTGTAAPVILTSLTPYTTYQVSFYTTCGTSGQTSPIQSLIFRTDCTSHATYPYVENFDGVLVQATPCGYTVLNATNDDSGWLNAVYPAIGATATSPNCMRYRYNSSKPGDDWFFTPGLQMQAGTTYQLQFKYRGYGSLTEAMEVKVGPAATAAGQTTTVFSNLNFHSATYATTSAGTGAGQVASFTPPTSGTYYFGFHAISPANQWYIFVDDIQVTASTLTATKSTVGPGFRAEASPVPFGEQLTLSLNTLQAGPLQLTLHDAVGRVVRQSSTTVPAGASSLAVPEAGTLPAGMYLLTVRQGGNTQVVRVAHE